MVLSSVQMVESCLLAEWSVNWMVTYDIGWFMTSLMDNFVDYSEAYQIMEYFVHYLNVQAIRNGLTMSVIWIFLLS